jgi:hypothetical protein
MATETVNTPHIGSGFSSLLIPAGIWMYTWNLFRLRSYVNYFLNPDIYIYIYIFELGYNVIKGTDYFVSL